MHKHNLPRWMVEFHAEHGVWPIAGASSDAPEAGSDTVTISDSDDGPDASAAPEGVTPPATPAPTSAVDPGAFQRGTTDATPPTPDRVFTAADVEKARKEEKDKVYSQIEQMKNELKSLREAQEEEKRLQEEEEARQAEAAAAAEEDGLDVKEFVRRKEAEWRKQLAEVRAEAERDRAALAKERELAALQEYRASVLETNAERIMPHLTDLVVGDTREEIDAAVERAAAKTEAIMADVAAAQQQQRQAMPTTRVTQPGTGPMEQVESSTRQLSAEDIRNMPMSEYMKIRDKLVNAASQRVTQGGLYG